MRRAWILLNCVTTYAVYTQWLQFSTTDLVWTRGPTPSTNGIWNPESQANLEQNGILENRFKLRIFLHTFILPRILKP